MKVRNQIAAAIVIALASVVLAQSGVHPISGRRFAGVMGAEGADWLDRPERVEEEAPDKALDVMGIRTGSTVADVGAGSGYFTIRLSARVGPTGRVYANDLQPRMLSILDGRLRDMRITNVTLVRGEIDDPRLPVSS